MNKNKILSESEFNLLCRMRTEFVRLKQVLMSCTTIEEVRCCESWIQQVLNNWATALSHIRSKHEKYLYSIVEEELHLYGTEWDNIISGFDFIPDPRDNNKPITIKGFSQYELDERKLEQDYNGTVYDSCNNSNYVNSTHQTRKR